MESQRQSQFTSNKKIYTIKVKSNKNFNPFQYMNPYIYLQELNKVIQRRGYDIQILEVKYLLTKSKAQKSFELYDLNRFDFQIDKTKNVVFGTDDNFLDWIYSDAVKLTKPDTVETHQFDNIIEEEKKKEQEKKITDIEKFLDKLMTIYEEGKKPTKQFNDMISIPKFKNFDHSCFRDNDYNIFVKALMSEPVKLKLDEQKDSGKGFAIDIKNIEVKSYLHPQPAVQSPDKVQDLAEITSFTLGCSAPQASFLEGIGSKFDTQKKNSQYTKFQYFDTKNLQTYISQKHNQSVQVRSFVSLNSDSYGSDTIKSFDIQTYYFDQSVIKTQVNMGQIKKIQIFNDRTNSGIVQYYFYLSYPPKYFISQLKKEIANAEEYMPSWERIENVFFLRSKRIATNDLLRLYLFNNTILKITLNRNEYTPQTTFQKPFETLERIKQKFDDKISIPIIDLNQQITFKWGIKSLQPAFNYDKFFLPSLSKVQDQNQVWILKFFILIMVRYDHLYPTEINSIIKEIQQCHADLPIYIYVFWKIATDIWGYNNKEKRFRDFLFDQVKSAKALDRKHMMRKIIKNTEMIAHVFRMNSAPSGFLYAAPTPQMKGRLLKKYDEESEYFLRVAVCDDHEGTLKNQKYITKAALKSKMLELNILGRKYIPLGWSPSQLRAYSLWYIHQTNDTSSGRRITREQVLNFLGSFDTIENPAKRAARIGQSFSASWTYDASRIKYIVEDDIISDEGFLFTDGIGKISRDLIESISLKLGLTELAVIQIRYLGGKGILVLDESLPKNTVVLRPSMIKYKCQHQAAAKYLDILDYNKYKSGFLNRQIIILLKTLRIPDIVFQDMQKTHIQNISQMSFKDCSVFKQMNDDLNTQINNLEPANKTILSLVRAGFDLELEPFFRGVLETMKKNGYNQLKNKCNIRVEKSARIIGIIDEFGVLNEKEVYCAIYDPFSLKKQSEKLEIINEPAVITRNPCLDPADIRWVKCVGQEQIKARFQELGMNNKFEKFLNCIIFPKKGKIPLTSQISGSDLDGDNFFICWDQRLVPKDTEIRKIKTIDAPTTDNKQKPIVIKKEQEMYKQMMNFFFEYINYEKLGQIDNSHLVKADSDTTNYADNADCIKLSEIHGKAVDFPKTGYCPEVDPKLLVSVYPDFMEKEENQQYVSQSILGKLYREIKSKIQDLLKDKVYKGEEKLDVDLIKNVPMNFTKEEVQEVMDNLLEYEKSLANLIKLVGIDTEYEIYSGNFSIAKQKVDQYGKTRLISTVLQLRQRYFQLFFDGLTEDEDTYLQIKEQNLEHEQTFTEIVKRRAILYYICSYVYKFGDKLKFPILADKLEKIRTEVQHCIQKKCKIDTEGKFCGFVWFVIPKVIINIKKLAIAKNKIQTEGTQPTENKKGDNNQDEDEQIEEDNNQPKDEDDEQVI